MDLPQQAGSTVPVQQFFHFFIFTFSFIILWGGYELLADNSFSITR
jgi:hypothetical protein